MLIDAADRTLDVQYFIFEDDLTGKLLSAHLLAAADRGVRVRLLVDDWNQEGKDHYLARLAAHRNIEARTFNPVTAFRTWSISRPVTYALGPKRIQKRMHNKALIDPQHSQQVEHEDVRIGQAQPVVQRPADRRRRHDESNGGEKASPIPRAIRARHGIGLRHLPHYTRCRSRSRRSCISAGLSSPNAMQSMQCPNVCSSYSRRRFCWAGQ